MYYLTIPVMVPALWKYEVDDSHYTEEKAKEIAEEIIITSPRDGKIVAYDKTEIIMDPKDLEPDFDYDEIQCEKDED